ncbi:MAG TPA: hypothetical protein PK127_10455 [Clostridiales bacterium]|jgi:hypothetical protein|nr:hypothetical protein [Clostridiales bacterium]
MMDIAILLAVQHPIRNKMVRQKGDISMRNGFMKGVMIGGLVAVSVGFMMNTDIMSNRTRRKMVRSGRNLVRKASNVICDAVDLFR